MMAFLIMASLHNTGGISQTQISTFIFAVCSCMQLRKENLQKNIGPAIWNDAWADCLAVGLVCKSELHSLAIQGL
ncbi:hypothetical protein ASPVEDRAFT_590613 [Aspergillus versicolor CBS 583.65]|uniref:Uncharacterized protein n=1 Tax=Aspergillus versicolor CBS 583.65 TaxID=1036611 RepID=A0A1L9PH12_ASPVE|nr:uncharacterized protein ASPVEDRAFT_590613 [Aspergillus versicolor CBS 583.65]OJJ00817.1 hypothetical protein ASPVEDRAFT_590613 [Aspergillus versicolor CBS 583.65]